MPNFRIFYIASDRTETFRAKAGAKPPYVIHRSHYEEGPEISAADPYALWFALRYNPEADGARAPRAVGVGDVLESKGGLLLCNFWGFEPAEWRAAPMKTNSRVAQGRSSRGSKRR